MKRKGVWILAAVALLAALSSCDLFDWSHSSSLLELRLVANGRDQGTRVALYPDYPAGGLEVLFYVSGGTRILGYAIDYGDGTNETSVTNLPEDGEYRFTHLYRQAGTFVPAITSGNRMITASVTVLNDRPVIDELGPLPYLSDGTLVRLCGWPTTHGCSTDGTLEQYGIRDSDLTMGDTMFYRVSVRGPNPSCTQTVSYTTFNRVGEVITGEWLPVAYDQSGFIYDAAFYVEIGNSGDEASAAGPFDTQGCTPVDPPPPSGDSGLLVYFTVEAYDLMMSASDPVVFSWEEEYVGEATCGGE